MMRTTLIEKTVLESIIVYFEQEEHSKMTLLDLALQVDQDKPISVFVHYRNRFFNLPAVRPFAIRNGGWFQGYLDCPVIKFDAKAARADIKLDDSQEYNFIS